MLLARTHGGNFANAGASGGRRPASSLWSMDSSMAPSGPPSRGGGQPADRGGGAGGDKRFYMTAPAAQMSMSNVEEATGVRLSKDQLHALRKRYQSGYTRLGESGGFGKEPTSDDLRQEVFGSGTRAA